MINPQNKLKYLVDQKVWRENLIETVTSNPAKYFHALKKATEAVDAFVNCKWTRIEGNYPESLINIPVYVSFDEDVQEEFYCMRFCVQRNSMEWYHLENDRYEWELFSNICTSGITPTHYLVPVIPEPPIIIPESLRY